MKMKKKATTDMVGTILVLAITVSLFSGIMYFVWGLPPPDKQIYATFSGTLEYSHTHHGHHYYYLNMTHLGGDILYKHRTEIIIEVYGFTDQHEYVNHRILKSVGDCYPSIGHEWNVGEIWRLDNDTSTPYQYPLKLTTTPESTSISVTIIDTIENSIIWTMNIPSKSYVGPVIMYRGTVPSPVEVNSVYTVYAKVVDPDNDLDKVWVDFSDVYTRMLFISYMLNPDEGINAFHPHTERYELQNLPPIDTEGDYTAKIYATDKAGHKTMGRLPIKVKGTVSGSPTMHIDLTIREPEKDITFSNPQPVVNEKITITAAISNLGDKDAEHAKIEFWDQLGTTYTKIGYVDLSVPGYGRTLASIKWTPREPEYHTIWVNVTQVFPYESNTYNNKGSKQIGVFIFIEDLEGQSVNWLHDATILRINAEGTKLEYNPSYNAIDIISEFESDWRQGRFMLCNTAYHSYSHSYYMVEPYPRIRVGIDLVLALDNSASMSGQAMADLKHAVKHVISRLTSNDTACIWAFSNTDGLSESISLYRPWTVMDYWGRAAFNTTIDNLKAEYNTPLWDCIGSAIKQVVDNPPVVPGRPRNSFPAVIAFTDGQDWGLVPRYGRPAGGWWDKWWSEARYLGMETGSEVYCPWHDWNIRKTYTTRTAEYYFGFDTRFDLDWKLTTDAYSGKYALTSYKTGDAHPDYNPIYVNKPCQISDSVYIPTTDSWRLEFYHKRMVSSGWGKYYYQVQISTDDGNNWNTIWSTRWLPWSWDKVSINLNPYKGKDIKFRFRVYSTVATVYSGWSIDDVKILSSDKPIFYDGFETDKMGKWIGESHVLEVPRDGQVIGKRWGLLNTNKIRYRKPAVYTIGLGLPHHTPYKPNTVEYDLWKIANTSNKGKYFYAPDSAALDDICVVIIEDIIEHAVNHTRIRDGYEVCSAGYIDKEPLLGVHIKDKYLQTAPISLEGADSARLSFWHRFNLIPAGNGAFVLVGIEDPIGSGKWKYRYVTPVPPYNDNTNLKIKRYDDYGNRVLFAWNGKSAGGEFKWQQNFIDLSDFVPGGKYNPAGSKIKIRFQYFYFEAGGRNGGWWIDDVELKVSRDNKKDVTSTTPDQWMIVDTSSLDLDGDSIEKDLSRDSIENENVETATTTTTASSAIRSEHNEKSDLVSDTIKRELPEYEDDIFIVQDVEYPVGIENYTQPSDNISETSDDAETLALIWRDEFNTFTWRRRIWNARWYASGGTAIFETYLYGSGGWEEVYHGDGTMWKYMSTSGYTNLKVNFRIRISAWYYDYWTLCYFYYHDSSGWHRIWMNRAELPWSSIWLNLPTGTNGLKFYGYSYDYYQSRHIWIDYVRIYGTPLNKPPTLSYSSESGYNDGIKPDSGYLDTTFTYKVVYTDKDNDAPAYVRVIIDGSTIANMVRDTDAENPALRDGRYDNGEQYVYSTQLSPIGYHWFHFEASDGRDSTRLPSSGEINKPTVKNRLPKLSYSSEVGLDNGVDPDVGYTFSTYTYKVVYTDADNHYPNMVRVVIDGTEHDMTRDLDALDHALRDGNYKNGEQYKYTTQLSLGPHNFYFRCQDACGDLDRLPPAGVTNLPLVTNAKPFLTYSFEDGYGNGNTGTLYNDVTWLNDYALKFDGSGDYVKITDYSWISVPNPSFESGSTTPQRWTLVNPPGAWENVGIHGSKSISISGTPTDKWAIWYSDSFAVSRMKVYEISYYAKSEPGTTGATVFAGFNSPGHVDIRIPPDRWTKYAYLTLTPSNIESNKFRIGQWRVDGKVYFDKIEIKLVVPIHRTYNKVVLGSDEKIVGNKYIHESNMHTYTRNYMRVIDDFETGYNTNRWLFWDGNYVIFKYKVGDYNQLKGEFKFYINYYNRGSILLEASKDKTSWTEIGSYKGTGWKKVKIPKSFYPVRILYLRLRGVDCWLQVNKVKYESKLDSNIPDITGWTTFSNLNIHDAVSMEAWIKIDVTDTRWHNIMSKGAYTGKRNYNLYVRDPNGDGTFYLHLSNNKDYSRYAGTVSPQLLKRGKWYHVVGIISSANRGSHIYYVDGQKVAEYTNLGYTRGLTVTLREWGIACTAVGAHANNLQEFRDSFIHEKILKTGILSQVNYGPTDGDPLTGRKSKFSLQYEGYVYIPKDGTYTFAIDGDDGVVVLINDIEVASWYGGHGFEGGWSHKGDIKLTRGYHKFEVCMQEWYGGDGVKVAWKKPGDSSFTIIPASNLYRYCPFPIPNTGPFCIGGFSRSNYFKGSIDNVRIYNRVLSGAEIAEHYRGIFDNNQGLVGLWQFNEGSGSGTIDESGSGNVGRLYNDVRWVCGASGRMDTLQFNAYAYVEVQHSDSLSIHDAVSMEAWIKIDVTDTRWHNIMSKGAYTGKRNYNLYVRDPEGDGTFYLHLSNNKDYSSFIGTVSPQLLKKGKWHHVVGIITSANGGSHIYYVDGQLVSERTNLGFSTLITNDGPFCIGRADNYFKGSIDNVRIYNRVLSQQEIYDNYNGEYTTDGLCAYWRFCEGYGDKTYDYAGDGINPDSGTQLTTFRFKVIYTDIENRQPTYIRIVIDGKSYSMTTDLRAKANYLRDYNYANGEQFVYAPWGLPLGSHKFYFIVSDGTNIVRLPEYGYIHLPTVSLMSDPKEAQAHSQTHAFYHPFGFIDGKRKSVDNSLYLRIDLSGVKTATLITYIRFNVNIDEAGLPPCGFRIEVSSDNGETWTCLNKGASAGIGVSGTDYSSSKTDTGVTDTPTEPERSYYWVRTTTMKRMNCDLTPFTGSGIILRFRVIINNVNTAKPWEGGSFLGLYIDDIMVIGSSTTKYDIPTPERDPILNVTPHDAEHYYDYPVADNDYVIYICREAVYTRTQMIR